MTQIVRPLFALGVFLAFASAMWSRDPYAEQKEEAKPATVSAPVQKSEPIKNTWKTMAATHAACRSHEMLDRLHKIAEGNDSKAFETLLLRENRAGNCRLLMKGLTVYVEDYSFWNSSVCLRPKGEPDCYHAAFNAIEIETVEPVVHQPTADLDASNDNVDLTVPGADD